MYRSICTVLFAISVIANISGYPEIDNEVCANHQDGVKLAVNGSCSHYYHCEANTGYLIDCSNYGLYSFDPKINQCNFADEVDCIDSSPSNTPISFIPLQNQANDGKVSIHAPEYDTKLCKGRQNYVTLGIRGSCTLYYTCLDDIGYLEDCKLHGNYQFDTKSGKCKFKRDVKCDDTDEIALEWSKDQVIVK